MKKALALHPDAEVVFFLGDGLSDIEPLIAANENICWLPVRGNCDYTSVVASREIGKTERISLCGKRIVYTHGDLYGVKYGLGGVLKLADDSAADIVLFGHTHIPVETYQNTEKGRGVYLFNPGSIGMSYRSEPTYGVIMLTESGALFSHGSF